MTVPNHANYEIKAVVYLVFIPKMLMLPLRLASSHCIVIAGKKAVVVACMGCVCVLCVCSYGCVFVCVCVCVSLHHFSFSNEELWIHTCR